MRSRRGCGAAPGPLGCEERRGLTPENRCRDCFQMLICPRGSQPQAQAARVLEVITNLHTSNGGAVSYRFGWKCST